MACSKYCPEFVKEFKAILDEATNSSANEILQQALACLKKWKHCYKISQVSPKFFLTHMYNRGGLLLSPYNAHRNAARINRCGADIQQLINAIAMELAPTGKPRDAQIKANEALVKRFAGLLAPVNGAERYLTLGCGHTVGFCKAADAGAKTSEKSIADAKGMIDSSVLKKNAQFKQMIEDGWDWTIIEHGIDELFPAFAKIAQKALNVSNHVATEVSELETAVNLADLAEDPTITGVTGWQKIAVEHVQSLNVPAAAYADTILQFVTLFGGGKGAPMIKMMDSFAKQFQCNTMLGETWWTAVTGQVFPSKVEKLALLRIALSMANLTSPKVVDGIGKLIVKSDISKLAGKMKFPEAEAANQVLADGLAIVEQTCSIEASLQVVGKLFVRVALCVTDKGADGLEGKQYSIAESKQLFLDGLSEVIGGTVNFTKWTDAKKPAANPAPRASCASTVASMADLRDPVWVAKQAGFEVGKTVSQKGVSDGCITTKLWAIFAIGEVVALQQICSYNDTLHKVDVPLEEFLNKWSVTSSNSPLKMPMQQQRPDSLSTGGTRCLIFKVIQELDAKKGAAASTLCFWRRPDEVRSSSRPIPVGALQLVPVAGLINISTKNTPFAAEVKYSGGDKFYVVPPGKPALKLDQGLEWEATAIIAAYWWIDTTGDRKLANMEISYEEKNGVTVPVMTNTIEIPPFTSLRRYVKPQAKAQGIAAQLEGATSTGGDKDGKGNAKGKRPAAVGKTVPKKKVKK